MRSSARLCRQAIAGVLCGLSTACAVGAEAPNFERHVAPLLVDRCLTCHQPTKRSGELDLSTRTGLLAGGELGPAIDLAHPAASVLIERTVAGEMPPPEHKEFPRLSAAEVNVLRDWIAAGAPWPEERVLGVHEKSVDLASARSFWSFRPVERPALPPPGADSARAATPVDAFVIAAQVAAGMGLSPAAERRDLVRRLSLDLRGLPPSIEEQEAFLTDSSPDAYERLVDRWLADPAHGERWARYWLDLVRYADSNGYERDGAKPSVWRYRDYVIAALNGDKPYDQFVVEQIAGDELPDASGESLIATGFHALGTWQDEVDPLEAPQYRADELDDMVRTTSQAFLGITLGCARCHNHKFDPLTMVDYYSLVAILAPLKRPNEGRTDRDLPLGTPEQIVSLAKRDTAIARVEAAKKMLSGENTPENESRRAQLDAEISRLREATPDLPRVYRCVEDSAHAPTTHLLLSGRASNPGPVMQPRVPAVLATVQPEFPDAAAQSAAQSSAPSRAPSSTLRRLTLARWIASTENPLTARVIVNRVWQHHFGAGIVATPSDFGAMGARPTHPELLDWLADFLVHDARWSLKKLHRVIVMSEAYRQSSSGDRGQGAGESGLESISPSPQPLGSSPSAVDPDNKLLWHFPYRRLDAEAIRDSMLAAAGNLERQLYGPAVYLPIQQAAIEAHTDKQAAWQAGTEPDINRRTVYAYVKRTLLVPMLESFDFCDTTNSTDRRAITSIAPQALTLFNGQFVNRQAEVFAARLRREAGDDPTRQIDLAFRLALSRQPTSREADSLAAFLEAETPTLGEQALVQVCRVILNLNEFVYPN
jgi:hypothetical protein